MKVMSYADYKMARHSPNLGSNEGFRASGFGCGFRARNEKDQPKMAYGSMV